jgi:glycosyltransferase involved in cell wall biosynthesis
MNDLPRVTVLMATYQGAAFLEAQLLSIAAQTGIDWALWVSDDGSTDATRAILRAFRRVYPDRVRLLDGPQKGAAANFMSLLCHPALPSGIVALSDQDDIWYPDKLQQALRMLDGVPGPVLYSASCRYIGEDGRALGRAKPSGMPLSFGNALVQNRIAGHAAVLSPEALALVRRVGPVAVPFHDWWLYQLISGAGGTVISDPQVVLDYRQHAGNVLGAVRGPLTRIGRGALVLSARGQDMIAANRLALEAARPWLTEQARDTLDALARAPGAGVARARILFQLGVRRDALAANLFLTSAALFGKA